MKLRRLAFALALSFALSIGNTQAMELVTEQGCVSKWSSCRSDTTSAYFAGQVGTVRYSLLLDGCDFGYGACVMTGL
jgi:hypothetical protein